MPTIKDKRPLPTADNAEELEITFDDGIKYTVAIPRGNDLIPDLSVSDDGISLAHRNAAVKAAEDWVKENKRT